MITLGIDIGGSSVKVAALRDGKTLWTGASSKYSRPAPAQVAAAIAQAVAGRIDGVGAAGICIPGRLDAPRCMMIQSVNLPELQNVPLDGLLASALGVSLPVVKLIADANATALDIFAARNLDGRLLLLTIGTGVGASVWDASGPLRVEGESAGHIGQIDVSLDDDAPIAADKGRGGLEAYISISALRRQYGPSIHQDLSPVRVTDPPMRALARAIRICHAIYRPQHVCLAGGIGCRLGFLIDDLRASVADHLTSVADPAWTLSVADDDHHAARGAARWPGWVPG